MPRRVRARRIEPLVNVKRMSCENIEKLLDKLGTKDVLRKSEEVGREMGFRIHKIDTNFRRGEVVTQKPVRRGIEFTEKPSFGSYHTHIGIGEAFLGSGDIYKSLEEGERLTCVSDLTGKTECVLWKGGARPSDLPPKYWKKGRRYTYNKLAERICRFEYDI